MAINKSTESLIKGYREFNSAKVACSFSKGRGAVIWEGDNGRKGELCRSTSLISCAVKITMHQLLKWGLAMTEMDINSRRENKLSIYWAGMSALVAFGWSVRILARKEERLAFQQTRTFHDMAVYYITFVASKIRRCWQELMFPEQIHTVDTKNASFASESGKHTGSHKIFYYSICVFMPPKQIYINILLCCGFLPPPVSNVYFPIKRKFHLD